MNREETLRSFRLSDGTLTIPNPRSFFDSFSDEFKRDDYGHKLMVLAALVSAGMSLTEFIRLYIDSHSEIVLASLRSTLLSYIQFLRWGTSTHWTDELLEEATALELAQALQSELKLRYLEALNELIFSFSSENAEREFLRRVENDKEIAKSLLLGIDFSRNVLLGHGE